MPKPKREYSLPRIQCKHETDSTLWRLCAGTNLKECVVCYEMQEVS